MIIAVLATGLMAQAQTSTTTATTQQSGESTAKIQSLQKKDEQMKDIDQEITNNKMRAELGSKSKWSVRTYFNYQGGTVKKAFSEERPDIRSEGDVPEAVGMSGDIAVKYRLGDRGSLNFGTGVSIDKLFHRTADEATNSNASKTDGKRNASISNPYLEYNTAYKLGAIQNVSSVTYTQYTEKYYQDAGFVNNVSLAQIGAMELGNNTLGLAFALTFFDYEDSKEVFANGNKRTEINTYLSPFYEYSFNDKYNFRTVANWFTFNKKRGESDFNQAVIQQSVGLGISVTRDLFLYPNIQFIPQDIRADRTNVALSANINVF
jgi:hypothetical protein